MGEARGQVSLWCSIPQRWHRLATRLMSLHGGVGRIQATLDWFRNARSRVVDDV
jgi:hypothetical protein